MEELRRFPLEGVADELENPSEEEQSQRKQPQAVPEDAGDKKRDRKQDGWNPQRVTHAVHRIPMTGAVLRDPLLVAASAQDAQDHIMIAIEKTPDAYAFAETFSRRNLEPSVSTGWSQRKRRYSLRPRRSAPACKRPTNRRVSPDLHESFPSYRRRSR